MTALHHSSRKVEQDDGWIEWAGGKCPVATEAKVEVVLRSRRDAGARPLSLWARDLNWRFNDDPGDIVSYRIIQS